MLVSTNLGVSAQQVLAELPSVEETIGFAMVYKNVGMPHATCSHAFNLFYPLAAASEKLGDYDKSLEYIDAGLSTDITRAGTQLPIARAVFTILRGRVLATAGRRVEAGAALEGAATASNGLGLWVTEALALLELKLCVLDPMGHSEHGSRRLGAALRKLKGPADKLNQLLKGGLDAAELMAMPLPDPSHTVVYDVQGKGAGEGAISDQLARLRAEYEGLKTMALHARAVSEGLETRSSMTPWRTTVPRPLSLHCCLKRTKRRSVRAWRRGTRRQRRHSGVRSSVACVLSSCTNAAWHTRVSATRWLTTRWRVTRRRRHSWSCSRKAGKLRALIRKRRRAREGERGRAVARRNAALWAGSSVANQQ